MMSFGKKIIMLSLLVSASTWLMQSANASGDINFGARSTISAQSLVKGAPPSSQAMIEGPTLVTGIATISSKDYAALAKNVSATNEDRGGAVYYFADTPEDLKAVAGVAEESSRLGIAARTNLLLSAKLVGERDFSDNMASTFGASSTLPKRPLMLAIYNPVFLEETKRLAETAKAIVKTGTSVTLASGDAQTLDEVLSVYKKPGTAADIAVPRMVYNYLSQAAKANVVPSDVVTFCAKRGGDNYC